MAGVGVGCEAEPLDAGQNVVSRFGPEERLGVGVDGLDVGFDGSLQFDGRAMDAAADLSFGELGEEALDVVDSGG
jgi:hypothetical protein